LPLQHGFSAAGCLKEWKTARRQRLEIGWESRKKGSHHVWKMVIQKSSLTLVRFLSHLPSFSKTCYRLIRISNQFDVCAEQSRETIKLAYRRELGSMQAMQIKTCNSLYLYIPKSCVEIEKASLTMLPASQQVRGKNLGHATLFKQNA
jgi:hypothetical protein